MKNEFLINGLFLTHGTKYGTISLTCGLNRQEGDVILCIDALFPIWKEQEHTYTSEVLPKNKIWEQNLYKPHQWEGVITFLSVNSKLSPWNSQTTHTCFY